MGKKKRLAPQGPPPPSQPDPEALRPVAVIDIGASALRLVVAEAPPGQDVRVLEEASRSALLGKDTFASGRIGAPTLEAMLKALEGFRRIMDSYGVVRYRAVATSAVREASNRETVLDRVRLRTGIEVEIIDGSEENRLGYLAVREALRGHSAFAADATLLVEVGGGSADISFLRKGEPAHSGTYALGAVRLRQNLATWHGPTDQRVRLLRRHIQNVVDDIDGEMPLAEVTSFVALGGEVRLACEQVLGEDAPEPAVIDKAAFLGFCDSLMHEEVDAVAERFRLPPSEAETLVPALLAYRELICRTAASNLVVPEASLRTGLLLDLVRSDEGRELETFRRQVLASAAALGDKYRYDALHARNVAHLAVRLFDEMRREHGLSDRDRLLLEVAALLHDIGAFVSLRGHHKHAQYLISVSELFGLSREDLALVGNVARYHRRGLPQKSHLPWMALDREGRVVAGKLAAILRLANALDADHLQKVKDVRVATEAETFVIEAEGAGDLTIERLVTLARADLATEVFGRRFGFREATPR